MCCSEVSYEARELADDLRLLAIGDGLERSTALGALRRSGLDASRRRPLASSPPALERRFIAFPVGWRHRTRSKGHAGSGRVLAGRQ